MPQINFSLQDFQSLSENVARVKLSNMYIVENPLSLSGRSYIPRPSLTEIKDFGTSAFIRGIWAQSYGGSVYVYVVAGGNLYTLNEDNSTTLLGTIPGTGPCFFTSSLYHTAIVSDGSLTLVSGNVLIPVSIPDGLQATDVTNLDNYLIVGIKNSTKFYWINPGETTIDGLSFASAERNPDDLVSIAALGDEVWGLGQNTTEVFVPSGDPDAPFIRTSGRAYSVGCIGPDTVVKTLFNQFPCLIWVTPSKEVVLGQGAVTKISNQSVEEKLKESSWFSAWSFRTNRHDFYVLTTDVCTLVYDLTTQNWVKWSSYGQNTWKASKGFQIDDKIYAGGTGSGLVYTLGYNSAGTSSDFLVCEVSAFLPNDTKQPTRCDLITLFLNYGFSSSYINQPTVELRWSDDGGNTWSDYVQGSTGTKGLYDSNILFRSLGLFRQPGRYLEVRFSDSQSFRFDGAMLND